MFFKLSPIHYVENLQLIIIHIIMQALSEIGALFGGPAGGLLADRLGRRWAMILTGAPFFIGYIMLATAHYSSNVTSFKFFIMTGRFLSGVGMGWGTSVLPVSWSNAKSMKYHICIL